jgi:hypothetical protein
VSACILKIWNKIRMGRANPKDTFAPTVGRNQGVGTVAGFLFAPTAWSSTFASRAAVGRFARSMEGRNIHVESAKDLKYVPIAEIGPSARNVQLIHARMAESDQHARNVEVKAFARTAESNPYARNVEGQGYARITEKGISARNVKGTTYARMAESNTDAKTVMEQQFAYTK